MPRDAKYYLMEETDSPTHGRQLIGITKRKVVAFAQRRANKKNETVIVYQEKRGGAHLVHIAKPKGDQLVKTT